MELLNILNARSVWLFDINELNPKGKTLFPEILEWIAEEYHFEKAPKSLTDLDDTKALAFTQGTYQIQEEIFIAVELKMYSDGLIANSWSSTRDTDAFLTDVLTKAASEFSLAYKPDIIRRKTYFSELNLKSAKYISGVNAGLVELARRLSEHLPVGAKSEFEPAGVLVSPIQGMTPTMITPFRFERRNNTSPEERKFYSTSPLHTDDHMTLLDWFEQTLMG